MADGRSTDVLGFAELDGTRAVAGKRHQLREIQRLMLVVIGLRGD